MRFDTSILIACAPAKHLNSIDLPSTVSKCAILPTSTGTMMRAAVRPFTPSWANSASVRLSLHASSSIKKKLTARFVPISKMTPCMGFMVGGIAGSAGRAVPGPAMTDTPANAIARTVLFLSSIIGLLFVN